MRSLLGQELTRSISLLAAGHNPAPRFRVLTPAREYMIHLHPEASGSREASIGMLVCAVGYFMRWQAATSFVFTAVYRGPGSQVGDALFACEADRASATAVVQPIDSFHPFRLGEPDRYLLPDCPIAFDASLLLTVRPPPPRGLTYEHWPHVLASLLARRELTLAPETAWLTGAGHVLN